MDLLSPCRSCLQCLPFFHVSPPSSPRRSSEATRSERGHRHASPHSEAPSSEQALDSSKGSDELCKGDNFSRQVDHHSHDTAMALHGAEDDDDERPHHLEVAVPQSSSLETSSSAPELDTEAEVGTDVVPAMEESYHSESLLVSEADHRKAAHDEVLVQHSLSDAALPRRRRHDHLRDQLKGITQQIKRGGLHIKEEGSKHMQKIMENMSKPAQQIKESGSFSTAPRTNNNSTSV